ncbi:MAG: DNA-binding response regulator [Firmicutes bacterium HGW-Firmicutes-7]|nr:MAG: DNA-binding response regulator [Firmicutes bacterium HGW-Firmicutes-7]
MYRLMLVDDEYAVRRHVIDRIDWHQYDFDIVCQAENGKEAYELFEQYLPDVVITDIKMPFVDGLELSEKILKKYPYTKIIVLTGFDEFEYAKKSINLHIMNYILKPVSANSLIEILEDVKVKLDEEIKQKRDIERLREYYQKSLPMLRDKFLEDFVKGEYLFNQVEEWLSYYLIPLKGKFYIVSVIQIDNFYKESQSIDTKETEFKKMALLELVEEVNKKEDLGIYFLSNNQVIIISQDNLNSENVFLQSVTRKLEMIRQGIVRYQTFTITIGVGHVCKSLEEIPNSRKGALSALDYKLITGNNQIIYINDLEHNEIVTLEFNEFDGRRVVRMLKSSAVNEFHEFIDHIFMLVSSCHKMHENQLYLFELVTQMIITAKELKIDLSKIEETEFNLFKLLGEDQQVDQLKNKILCLGEYIMEAGAKSRQITTANLVTLAKAYVEEEYMDWALSIQKICEYLNYSPNYFSSVFKKETGQAFMNYLMDRRLEAAKELLLTTEMKSLEVALEVGFSSSNYFAYCFKRHLNVSPMQYRKDNICL